MFSKRKNIFALIVMIILLAGIGYGLISSNITDSVNREIARHKDQLHSIARLVDDYVKEKTTSLDWLRENLKQYLEFMKASLSTVLAEGEKIDGIESGNSMVLQITDDEVVYPDHKTDGHTAEPSPEMIQEAREEGYSIKGGVVNTSGNQMKASELALAHIQDDYYFFHWTNPEEYKDYIDIFNKTQETISALEESFEQALLLCEVTQEDDGKYNVNLVSSSMYFPKEQMTELSTCIEDAMDQSESTFVLDGVQYAFITEGLSSGQRLMLIIPWHTLSHRGISRSIFIFLLILLVIICLFVYLVNLQRLVCHPGQHMDRLVSYRPRKIYKKIIAAGLLSAIVILAIASFIHAMELLQEETVVINRKMNSLLDRLEQSREVTEVKGIALETQFYVNFGTSLANLLSLYPELAEWPEIETISDSMNADYIMVFDSDGKEISCSQDYVGYDLTSSAYEELHDFARLLNGVPSIVHPVALDSVTGHNCVKLGITIPGTSRDDSHGALIIALHPESLDKAQSMDTLNEELKYLISEQEVYFTVDDGSEGEIVDSSERSLIGTEIMDYGLPQDSLMNNYKGFAKIDDNQYYVVTKQKDKNVYYLSSSLLKLFEGILSYGVLAAGCFIVLYATLVILLMSRYTESAFKKWISSDQLAELSEEPAPARKAISSSNFPWIQEFRIRWQKKLPEEKTTTVFVWLLCLILVVFFISDLIELSISNNPDLSLFQFIMRGDWIRGLNLLAFAAVFVLISLAFLLLVALNRILALTNLFLGNRGKTICRLIFSLINYIVILSVIYLSLEYLGFSPGTILAGLGIIGLGITLGAKDIIADVFSGIMLVFEDEFQVGEYIQIGNFKGKVETIGIRATQITDDGNNIKTVNNKEIKEVINLSRKHSGCEVEFVLPIETPAQQVRDILEQNLPGIRKNSDLLIGDPVYLGISRTDRSTMTITVFAPCLEQDVSHVQRYLNEEVLKILNDVSNSAQS